MIPEAPTLNTSSIDLEPAAAASAEELLKEKSCVAAIDMDCFYAQCEELRRPELKGKPVGVQQKMLVITSNYAARAFGIKKGDSLQVVKEKCPEITICNGEDLTFYGQVSQQVFDVASRFSSKVEKLGLDEVFVDVSEQVDERLRANAEEDRNIENVCGVVYPETDGDTAPVCSSESCTCWKRLSVGASICNEIREAIKSEVGLTSSAGVSVSKLLAKLVASWKKPAQQTVFIPTASRLSKLLPDTLAIQKIPGIGFASTQRCNVLNIHSIGQLVSAADASVSNDKHPLLSAFDANTIKTMRFLCLGIDKSGVKASGAPKSCSAEDSFWQKPLCNVADVKSSLEQLARKLLAKVRSVEQNFGFRPVPTLSLSLRHAAGRDAEARRERRQMQLGSFKVGNPNCTIFKGDGTGSVNAGAETISENDRVLSKHLADRAFALFQKLVDREPFSLHILNLQVGFSEPLRGQQSLSFKPPVSATSPSVATLGEAHVIDLEDGEAEAVEAGEAEAPGATGDLVSLVAMGFPLDRAKRALEGSSLPGAIEELLKKPRCQLVELD
eukprot:Skav219819  [mRNA]  locus=scaffold147:416447:418114:+ [translate_table: standard]